MRLYNRTRCEDGHLLRHDPQPDDPYLETDMGQCPECEGKGCDDEPDDDDNAVDEDDYDPGEDCGRWNNGRLGSVYWCRLAGTEFCDFECPYRTR